MNDEAKAILALIPNAKFQQKPDGTLIWADTRIQPTETEIQEKIIELQAEYEANQYQRDRLLEYPSIQECIHAILDNDLEALQARRSAVKLKYPKPE